MITAMRCRPTSPSQRSNVFSPFPISSALLQLHHAASRSLMVMLTYILLPTHHLPCQFLLRLSLVPVLPLIPLLFTDPPTISPTQAFCLDPPPTHGRTLLPCIGTSTLQVVRQPWSPRPLLFPFSHEGGSGLEGGPARRCSTLITSLCGVPRTKRRRDPYPSIFLVVDVSFFDS